MVLAVVVRCCSDADRLSIHGCEWLQSPTAGCVAADGATQSSSAEELPSGLSAWPVFGEGLWRVLPAGGVARHQLRRCARSAIDVLHRAKLVVAPPSADLRAFAAFAIKRDLTVLLPYQRGQSLDTLRGLEGRERLWPIVLSQQGDLKALVEAAMEAGLGRAMVVEDPAALESTSSNAFVELFKAVGGVVESYEAAPVQRVDPSNFGRLQRFKDDMAWSWVPTVVVADAPEGPLAQQLRAEQQQGLFGGGAPRTPNWI